MKPTDTLDLRQAAEFLQLSEPTVKRLAEANELPGRKLGAQWRFLRSALEDFLKSPAEPTTQDRAASKAAVTA